MPLRVTLTSQERFTDMRTCNETTAQQIRAMSKNITHPRYPAWVVTAAWDAIHNRPMSAKRERRMCEALGIDPPPVMVETPACPDCGSVHNGGRCNGRPVTVRLVRQRTPPPAWVREATRNLEALRGKE